MIIRRSILGEITTLEYTDKLVTLNRNSQLHSFDDNPSEIRETGNKYWHKNGKLHRDLDPAVIMFKHNESTKVSEIWYKIWYKNGRSHRLDGPAIEPAMKYKYDFFGCWRYKGKKIKCNSLEEFQKIIRLKSFW